MIIYGCLSMWPLLVVCVMWAIVAGFFIWVFETYGNKEEFPRPFLVGLFEGKKCMLLLLMRKFRLFEQMITHRGVV